VTELLAYVDESIRSGRYLLGSVVVDAHDAGRLRRSVRKLTLPGQRRLHFNKEGNRRRRELIDALTRLDLEAYVFSCRHSVVVTPETARARCIRALVQNTQARGVEAELLIESRAELDVIDGVTVGNARRPDPRLSFQHLLPDNDPLLWLPDGFAWAVGAGGDWLRRVANSVTVVEVR
jgi:hypothetical protein